MTIEISNTGDFYSITDFEDYYEARDNYYLLKSYFYRKSISESLCQWHIGRMNQDGTHFEIITRLGSCHIPDEDNVFEGNFQKVLNYIDEIIENNS